MASRIEFSPPPPLLSKHPHALSTPIHKMIVDHRPIEELVVAINKQTINALWGLIDWTPLYVACSWENTGAFQLLIERCIVEMQSIYERFPPEEINKVTLFILQTGETLDAFCFLYQSCNRKLRSIREKREQKFENSFAFALLDNVKKLAFHLVKERY